MARPEYVTDDAPAADTPASAALQQEAADVEALADSWVDRLRTLAQASGGSLPQLAAAGSSSSIGTAKEQHAEALPAGSHGFLLSFRQAFYGLICCHGLSPALTPAPCSPLLPSRRGEVWRSCCTVPGTSLQLPVPRRFPSGW